MMKSNWIHLIFLNAFVVALLAMSSVEAARAKKRGGELVFVVGSKIPSYDGHVEGTFGMIHPIRPFYSLLVRVNPENPSSPTDFVCDICRGPVPSPSNRGTIYTFNIRKDIWFHSGAKLTARDVVATFRKIVFPPSGIRSTRKAFFRMVSSIEATDDYTVVFKLKHPSAALIPAIAMPFNFIYSKKDLDQHGYTWHRKNIDGTGAFVFESHQSGAFVKGKRYRRYHHKGRPFIDRFTSISAPQMSTRLQAIRGKRADIEFRGFPPKARDDMVRALGQEVVVQEST